MLLAHTSMPVNIAGHRELESFQLDLESTSTSFEPLSEDRSTTNLVPSSVPTQPPAAIKSSNPQSSTGAVRDGSQSAESLHAGCHSQEQVSDYDSEMGASFASATSAVAEPELAFNSLSLQDDQLQVAEQSSEQPRGPTVPQQVACQFSFPGEQMRVCCWSLLL